MKYSVGQVIYSILQEKQIIIPLKVVEEITIKNEQGEQTNYKVMLPNTKKQKVKTSMFKELFVDLDEVSNYMIENAKKAIDKMVEDAIYLEEDYFKESKSKDVIIEKEAIEDNSVCNNENNNVKIDLGDGKVASFNIDAMEEIKSNDNNESEK
tara:strand:+ start:166 stop:624 length:459 start_codon:yes stop_codon:yes gene_type:complete